MSRWPGAQDAHSNSLGRQDQGSAPAGDPRGSSRANRALYPLKPGGTPWTAGSQSSPQSRFDFGGACPAGETAGRDHRPAGRTWAGMDITGFRQVAGIGNGAGHAGIGLLSGRTRWLFRAISGAGERPDGTFAYDIDTRLGTHAFARATLSRLYDSARVPVSAVRNIAPFACFRPFAMPKGIDNGIMEAQPNSSMTP